MATEVQLPDSGLGSGSSQIQMAETELQLPAADNGAADGNPEEAVNETSSAEEPAAKKPKSSAVNNPWAKFGFTAKKPSNTPYKVRMLPEPSDYPDIDCVLLAFVLIQSLPIVPGRTRTYLPS